MQRRPLALLVAGRALKERGPAWPAHTTLS
jgi:hypothetical protein